MDAQKLRYFKQRLLNERERVDELLEQLRNHENFDTNVEMSSELSFYDNHSGDLGSEMNDLARGRAFKEHEISIIKKIEDALCSIEDGSYGVCHNCLQPIPEERLNFLPYAQYCVKCQNDLNDQGQYDKTNRGPEELVLHRPFAYGFNDYDPDGEVGFDAEDSLQSVTIFNRYDHEEEFYEEDEAVGFVEPIEKISNQQYRAQLPD